MRLPSEFVVTDKTHEHFAKLMQAYYDDSIEDEYTYPKDGHPDTMSWGRFPDGTGPFFVNSPTPGVANVKL